MAPAEEGARLRRSVVDGVVRDSPGGTPRQQVGFGQVGRVADGSEAEQGAEAPPVVVGCPQVGVAATELVEDLAEVPGVAKAAKTAASP